MADDRWAPAWDLTINDTAKLTDRHRSLIRSMDVLASVDGADTLTIQAEAWDSLDGVYRFAGETILGPGNYVKVYAGYTGVPLRPLQRFQVISEEVDYAEDGVKVNIRALSAAMYLVDYTQARKFPIGMTDSEIARAIAEDHGLLIWGSSLEDTPPRVPDVGRVKTQGTTDLDFLKALAIANKFGPPYVRWDEGTDQDVLYFRTTRISDQPARARFVYNPPISGITGVSPQATCYKFNPILRIAGVPTAVQVIGWDPVAQEPIAVTVEITAEGQKTTILKGREVKNYPAEIKSGSQLQVAILDSSKAADKTDKVEAFSKMTLTTTDTAVEWAARWLDTRSRAFVTASARVVGWEDLWILQTHEWAGTAAVHEGLWEVQEVKHTLAPGPYVCDVELVRVLEEAATPQEV